MPMIREWIMLDTPVTHEELMEVLKADFIPTAPIPIVREKTAKERLDPKATPGMKIMEMKIPCWRMLDGEVQVKQAD